MGQRPGFLVSKRIPTNNGSQNIREITVEIRVFAPHGTDADRIRGQIAEAALEADEMARLKWERKS